MNKLNYAVIEQFGQVAIETENEKLDRTISEIKIMQADEAKLNRAPETKTVSGRCSVKKLFLVAEELWNWRVLNLINIFCKIIVPG